MRRRRDVAKSIYAIGGLGIGTCVLLSLMMQHLLQVKTGRSKPAFALELEEVYAGRLAGPVEVSEESVAADGKKRMVLHMRVLAGLHKQRMAQTAGELVWRRMIGEKQVPDVLVVEVGDDAGGPVETVPVPRPSAFGQKPVAGPSVPAPAGPAK